MLGCTKGILSGSDRTSTTFAFEAPFHSGVPGSAFTTRTPKC